MPREIELKLSASPEVLDQLARATRLGPRTAGRMRTQMLETTYFDTPDLALAKAGLAVRVRRDGRRYRQSVKSEGTVGAIAERAEWEAPLPGPHPDPALIPEGRAASRIARLAAKRKLRPRLVTQITRRSRVLRGRAGDSITLCLDQGALSVPETADVLPVSEIELELISGPASALISCARDLAQAYPVRLAVQSKAGRGLDLITGTPHRPVKAKPVALSSDMSIDTALADTLSQCLAHALANDAAILIRRDPEGVHQLRVALRRLRSALSAFGKAVRCPEIDRLRDEAKWIAGVAGATRDMDVFTETTLEPLAAQRPDDTALAAFASLVQAARAQAWAELADALESARYRLFVIDLAAAIATRAWQAARGDTARRTALEAPLKPHATARLDKMAHAADALGQMLATLDMESRHRLRLRLKALRYTAEFFHQLWPRKRVRPYLEALSELQDVFGHLNDAATAHGIAARLVAQASAADPQAAADLAWAGGLVTGWHEARLAEHWPEAAARWAAFAGTPPFWR